MQTSHHSFCFICTISISVCYTYLYRISYSNGRKNVWGILRGKSAGPTMLLAGHLDTMGVDGCKDPFIPKVEEDRIYGRGSVM